jgi:hypothetical protein
MVALVRIYWFCIFWLEHLIDCITLALYFRRRHGIISCTKRIFFWSVRHVRNKVNFKLGDHSSSISSRCSLIYCLCLLLAQDTHLLLFGCRHDWIIVWAVRDRLLRAALRRIFSLDTLFRHFCLAIILIITSQLQFAWLRLWLLKSAVKLLYRSLISRWRNLAHEVSVMLNNCSRHLCVPCFY